MAEMKAIVPEVCDRLGCNVEACYGWDLCRQARAEATDKEWERLWSELFREAEVQSWKVYVKALAQSWKVLQEALARSRKIYVEALAQSRNVLEEDEGLNKPPIKR